MDLDVGVAINRGLHLVEKFLGVRAFQGKKQIPGQAAQGVLPLHQVGVKALVRQGQRRAHAGHSAPQHQGPGRHRNALGLDGGEPRRPAHRHGDQVHGLGQGRLRVPLMDPGALLPDIGKGEVARVQARARQNLPEDPFVGPGTAGGHHHPVEAQGLGWSPASGWWIPPHRKTGCPPHGPPRAARPRLRPVGPGRWSWRYWCRNDRERPRSGEENPSPGWEPAAALGAQVRWAVVNRRDAAAAAALAVVTDSGMSMGSRAVPHTSTPGRVVLTGSNGEAAMKPCSFNSNPRRRADAGI